MGEKGSIFRSLIIFAILVSTLACVSDQIGAPSSARTLNFINFTGAWEGTDEKSYIYTFNFTKNKKWEAHVEKDGAYLPYYKGRYTFTGTGLDMQITHERDIKTNRWMKDRGYLSSNISGRLLGETLKVTALTEANLTKKR